MWIAFIFSTFGITQQLTQVKYLRLQSCELLSYSVPLVLHNNLFHWLTLMQWVVNCFHIQYLWYYTTTRCNEIARYAVLWIAFIFSTFGITQQLPVGCGRCFEWLWIAFIFSTFGITQQLSVTRDICFKCCELLSYSVPLVIHNNLEQLSDNVRIGCELLSYSVPLVLHNNLNYIPQ